MNMTNKEAAAVLGRTMLILRHARGDGKSTTARLWTEAILKVIAVLEAEPRPVIIKGHIFERWYCPACHERVKKGGRFCHACGQAYREPNIFDSIPRFHVPPPPPPRRADGMRTEFVIIDEFRDHKK